MSKKSRKDRRAAESGPNQEAAAANAMHLSMMIGQMLQQALKLHQAGQFDKAQSLYDGALQLDADNFDAWHLRGVLEIDKRRFESAIRYLERSLAIRPNAVAAWQNLGIALRALKRPHEALAASERALQIAPDNPAVLNNRGNVLLEIGQAEAALKCYAQALALAPDFVEAYDNQGNALRELHRFEEALESYARAQTLAPDFPSAHWNESLCRLLMGDLAAGWRKYEWGWQTGKRGSRRRFAQPLWLGDTPIQGLKILLHAEQGFGDTIHFCRYATDVARLGAYVILEVPPALRALMESLQGPAQIVACGEPLPDFDVHCPLASLPLALRSDLGCIPSSKSYLTADTALVKKWSVKLGQHDRLRVGIAWSGNLEHSRNHQRSVPLQALLNLLSPGVQVFSLQKDLNPDEYGQLEKNPHAAHFGEDFANTAALISLMDVVISVDTSIAHLAAALGCPTWILLAYTPDWRWMIDRNDTPWYPAARLFRQSAPDDWPSVLEEVRSALSIEASSRGRRQTLSTISS
ncbi:MAG TPA: tetratricopeptide repeat-containing glycosyltransferase family protein [Rhodocyclaceae bacterium]|nr:tetratricopeptide repeat-containing glycosyltransferase family protein [Rhodocyclaceae bacterium]